MDENRRIVDERANVPVGDLEPLLGELRARFGAKARILVEDAKDDAQVLTRAHAKDPVQVVTDRRPDTTESIELAHAMLWDTYDRATRVQSWMLEQASAFTLELLENNRRLADQASELQKRHQAAMAELDYMQREQKMMEAEDAASRYSRHLIEKTKAEIAAAIPPRTRADVLDDIIDGAAVALGLMAGVMGPRNPRDNN
ncbi:MAG: hypothetical protein H0T76_27830 [Nannocystis sp.]|nr:hypothetical protein [Nannocystis sp.]MBA3550303.1 hypothetical protein [Nannocystis sp.]